MNRMSLSMVFLRGALERARATRAAGEQAVEGEIERLDALRRRALAMTTTDAQGEYVS